MRHTNHAAVTLSAVVAIVTGWLWYSPFLFGGRVMALRGIDPGALADASVPPGRLAVELVRCLVVACVLSHLIAAVSISNWRGAVRLAFTLWVGFPAMILVGSVTWEDVPWNLAALHAGDWLVKLLAMSVILGAWRNRAGAPSSAVVCNETHSP